MKYCRYILTLLVSLITIGAHADLNVELIETEMTLKKNGDEIDIPEDTMEDDDFDE